MSLKRNRNPEERRASPRYPLECDVRYLLSSGNPVAIGTGKTVNMSNCGVLFTTTDILSPETRLEVEIDWPVEVNRRVKLVLHGWIARSESGQGATAALAIGRHEFRPAT
jgi:hypothetical protein